MPAEALVSCGQWAGVPYLVFESLFCALWKVAVFRTREAELFLVGECEILVLGLPDSSMICMWVGRSHGS